MMECQLLIPKGKAKGQPYIPEGTQRLFHASPAAVKVLLGPMGSGKSLSLAMEIVIQALEEPRMAGWKALLARSTWEKLQSATWPMLLSCIPEPILAISKVRQSPYQQVILPNGAEIRGMNLADPEKFGSEELALQAIDECGEDGVAEEHFLWMVGRRRAGIGRRNILMAGHPAGRNWVWRHFFAWKEAGEHKRNPLFEGWQMTRDEAESRFDPDYMQMMRDTYPDAWLTRYLEGDFGSAEGQILTNFDRSVNVVPPVQLKDFWPRYRGLDHGLNHPTACSWTAVDLEGNLLTYREHHRKNITPAENTAAILAASSGEEAMVQWTAYDPHMSQRQTAGGVIQALISQYEAAGLTGLRKGNDDIRASIVLMQSLLKPDPEHHFPYWHPLKGQLGAPHWYITTDCPRLRWEMEQWKYMDVKPGRTDREKAVDKDDDLIDTVRYVLMERPQQAVWTPPPSNNQRILDIIAEMAAEKSGGAGGKWIGEERLR